MLCCAHNAIKRKITHYYFLYLFVSVPRTDFHPNTSTITQRSTPYSDDPLLSVPHCLWKELSPLKSNKYQRNQLNDMKLTIQPREQRTSRLALRRAVSRSQAVCLWIPSKDEGHGSALQQTAEETAGALWSLVGTQGMPFLERLELGAGILPQGETGERKALSTG